MFKDLHKPSSLADALQRNWTFWSIYCLEKQISTRSGRHSVRKSTSVDNIGIMLVESAKAYCNIQLIDDDEIDIEVPNQAISGNDTDWLYCKISIRLAQLSSRIWKKLSSSRALRQSTSLILQAIRELDDELIHLEFDYQSILVPDVDHCLSKAPQSLTLQQLTILRSMFYTLTFDIHTRVTYPWCSGVTALNKDSSQDLRRIRSRFVVLDTCRNAVLLMRHIKVDANTPLM